MQIRSFTWRFVLLGASLSLAACAGAAQPCPEPQVAAASAPAPTPAPSMHVAAKTDSFVGNVREAIQKNAIGAEEKTKLFPFFENADHTVNLIQTRSAVPAHHHVEHDELVMILEGKGTFTIEGQNHEVKAGDILLIPRHAVHSYVHQGDGITAVVSVFSPKFDPKDRIMAEKKP
jgi:mannose-6-phosphate isomerase-like protein (cupin superfamily)